MEWQQERYDLKRQLDAAQASQRFLEDEVDLLQKENKLKENKIEGMDKIIKELKEQDERTAVEWEAKVESVERLREEENKKNIELIARLMEELASVNAEQDDKALSTLQDIETLKEKNKDLEQTLGLVKAELEQVSEEFIKVRSRNEELIITKEELENSLINKREELSSNMERMTALQEEVALLKVENDAFKAASQGHASKGSSVFAEVDDNRRALKGNLDKLVHKCNELKKVARTKSSEVSKLRAEKSMLLKKVQDVCKNYDSNESKLIDHYKIRIKDLEEHVEDLKKEREFQFSSTNNSAEFRVLDSIFAAKRKEMEDLKTEKEKLSQTVLLKSETIYSLRKDIEKYTAEVAYELSEKMRLQEELDIVKTLTNN